MTTATSAHHSLKLSIPQSQEPGISIVGVLEQLEPGKTRGKKLALILHGSLGHKDYLYQKKLAHCLPIDSFRFDFRGNHETGGQWRVGAIMNDVADIDAVVAYLIKEYGYVIDLLAGHSRGVVSGMRWMCTSEEGKNVRGFVNVSGRSRLEKVFENLPEKQKELLKAQGYYLSKGIVARKEFVGKVTAADMEEFATFDTSILWDRFPPETHVLTLHGMTDRVVPPYDAVVYARTFGARKIGTHNLCYAENADHNFTGMSDFVVETILEWWAQLERGQLQTGIWNTGVRGKL